MTCFLKVAKLNILFSFSHMRYCIMSNALTRVDMLVIMVLFYSFSLFLFGTCYLDTFHVRPKPGNKNRINSTL